MTPPPSDASDAPSTAAILERARGSDPFGLDALGVRRISRQLRRNTSAAEARIALAGNVVFEPLPEYIEAHLACHGIAGACYTAAFGQPLQELLNASSALRQFDPNFVLLHFELDSLLPGLVDPRTYSDDCWRRALDAVLDEIVPIVHAAIDHTRAIALLTNFAGPQCYELGLADSRCEFGEQELVAQLNSALRKAFRSEPRVQLVDLCRLTALHGRARARDQRMYYLARQPWHESFLPLLAHEITRHVHVGLGRIRKCLVVDLDNTLWSGVLGEDGPAGVRVGVDDPVGRAHFDLQRRILAIRRRGILLAACSKNNPDDVDELFRVRADMPLRREDFTCMEIGWGMKHDGLRRIAQQLNIGTDSLVLLDDSPAEIELIRQLLPEVECVLVPPDPALCPACLDRVHSLDRAVITAEDLARTQQYRDNAARDVARREYADVHDYLHSLRMSITIEPASAQLLARAQQLFARTNQFNLTTRRYSLADLQKVTGDRGARLLMIRAQDRFGDLGWVGVVLLRAVGEPRADIDSFALSCRVMGRGIETAILNHVQSWCFSCPACEAITASYVPTRKNVAVESLYEQHGFEVVERHPDGAKRYLLPRAAASPRPCEWVHVHTQMQPPDARAGQVRATQFDVRQLEGGHGSEMA